MKDGKELAEERKQMADKSYEEFVNFMNNAWKKYDIEQTLKKKGEWEFKKNFVLDTKLFSLDLLPSEYDVFELPFSARCDFFNEVFDVPSPFSDRIHTYIDAFAYDYKFLFRINFIPKKRINVFHFLLRRKVEGTCVLSVKVWPSNFGQSNWGKKCLYDYFEEA